MRRARRKAAPAPARRATISLVPLSWCFRERRLVDVEGVVDFDDGKLNSPLLPLMPSPPLVSDAIVVLAVL